MILDPTKPLIAVFEKYRARLDPYTLFERFMEYVLVGFDISFSPIDRPFKDEEAKACAELFSAWVMTMNEVLKSKEWYDILGDVYMNYLSSTMKKHWTGQYFTPMHICELMAQIIYSGKNDGECVMENACGSGRMLLAAHVKHPGSYCCARDLDRTCCLMTACNFVIHGVRGEVVWGDGLDPTDFKGGWKINETLNMIGIPSARAMKKEESFSYRSGMDMMKEIEVESDEVKTPATVIQPKRPQEPIQYSLFD